MTTATRTDAIRERIGSLSAERADALDELAQAVLDTPWGRAYARPRAIDQRLSALHAEEESTASALGVRILPLAPTGRRPPGAGAIPRRPSGTPARRATGCPA